MSSPPLQAKLLQAEVEKLRGQPAEAKKPPEEKEVRPTVAALAQLNTDLQKAIHEAEDCLKPIDCQSAGPAQAPPMEGVSIAQVRLLRLRTESVSLSGPAAGGGGSGVIVVICALFETQFSGMAA